MHMMQCIQYIHNLLYFTLLYFTLKPPIRSGRINTTTTVTGWLIGPEIGIHPNSPPGDGVDYKALGPRLQPGLRSVAACRSCTVDEGKLIFSVVRSPTGCELCCLRMPVSRKLPSSSFLLLRLPVTADISPFWNGAPTIDMGRRIIPVCTPHLYWCSTYPSLAR